MPTFRYTGGVMTHQIRRVSRRAAARAARVQVLVTADESSLIDLELLAATLPMCATGRVFIEVADASQIAAIDLPPRMTVTWLDRSDRQAAAGELAGRAALAWANEMLCEADNTNRVYLLNQASAAHVARHLTIGLSLGADRIHSR